MAVENSWVFQSCTFVVLTTVCVCYVCVWGGMNGTEQERIIEAVERRAGSQCNPGN